MKPLFKAVLFDLDDTLVNAADHILGGFNYALSQQGFPQITENDLSKKAGRPLHSCYQMFAPGGDLEKFVADHREFQLQNMRLVKDFDGMRETLGELGKNGVKIGIITARYRPTTELIVKQHRLDEYVGAVVCGDDFPEGKPHPRPCLEAAKKLGVEAKNCLVVGDGCSDVMSGKAAGAKTCRALYGYGGRAPCEAKADFEITSIKQVLKIVFQ